MDRIDKTVLGTFKELPVKRANLHRLILFGSRASGDGRPSLCMEKQYVGED
jgi:predicted nucleotidyltransferase